MSELVGPIAVALDEGQRRWPSLQVDRERFAAYVDARIGEGGHPDRMHAGDLYLACACSDGQTAALEAFRETHVPAVEAHLRAMRVPDATIQDLIAQLTAELFTNAPPKIGQYGGRSSLRVWLQVVVARMALRVLDREKRYAASMPDETELGEAASPELAYLKRLYGDAFKAAFEEAVRTLSSRERNLLRYQYIDGLTGDDMARLYGTHRATIVRWLTRAREALQTQTRELLVARLAVDPKEFASIARLVQSQLDLSIRTLLAFESTNA